MAIEATAKSKMEARISELKKLQSDYFKVKKSERQVDGLDTVREELNRLKGILSQSNRKGELSEEDTDYVKSNFS